MTNAPTSISSPEVQPLKNEIHELEKKIQDSRNSQDKWNDRYLGWTVATVVLAAFCGVFSIVCQKKAAAIELDSRPDSTALGTKNEQLRQVLDDAAKVEIAKAQQAAGEAGERAGKAESGTATALGEVAKANERAAIAKKETEQLAEQAGILKQQNLATEGRIEGERKKRVELAASLLPRGLNDQSGLITKLSKFQPMPILFEYVDEEEAKALAEQIAFVFAELKWPIGRLQPHNDDLLRDGIQIRLGDRYDTAFGPTPRFDHVEPITNVIMKSLKDEGMDVGDAPTGSSLRAPMTCLLISIGKKPNHALEQNLIELAIPDPSPLGGGTRGIRLSNIRINIPNSKY